MALEPARLWFEANAKFGVPPYHPPGDSQSSSQVQAAHVYSVPGRKPTVALRDEDKAGRFIRALDVRLGDRPLQAHPSGNNGYTDEQVLAIYERLFTPQVDEGDGVQPDHWREIVNEYDCNLLTFTSLLYAVKSAAWRMFGISINVKAERCHLEHHASHPLGGSDERVDFVIMDGNAAPESLPQDALLYIVEGTNPSVFTTFTGIFANSPFVIEIENNTNTPCKVLNKCIDYMLLYGQTRMVITSFQEAIIMEIHHTTKACLLSFSDVIDNDMESTLFRAMLGMVVVQLDDGIPFDEFRADVAFHQFRNKRTGTLRTLAGRSSDPGLGPSSGSGSGSGSTLGSSKKRGASPVKGTRGKRTAGRTRSGRSGSDQESTTSASQRGTDGRTSTNYEDVNNANLITVPRTTRSVSRTTISTEVASKNGSVLHFVNFPISKILRDGLMEFERDPDTPFPSLPTSDGIPRLNVVRKAEEGSVGIIYEVELQNPASPNRTKYLIKVIDASLQTLKEYRNCYEQLKKEYKAYYLFELGKKGAKSKTDAVLKGLIQTFTPACYGLYRPKDKSIDVFALVIESAGSVNRKWIREWSRNDRLSVLKSALCLHSIGLNHGDLDERNIAYYENSEDSEDNYKFFDFGNSIFHRCPGMQHCEELLLLLFSLGLNSPVDDPPFNVDDFQLKTQRKYELPFIDLEQYLRRASRVKESPLLERLDELARVYNRLFK